MPSIKLIDGSIKHFRNALSMHEIAEDIDKQLACDALIARVDGKLVDLSFIAYADCDVEILTAKNIESLDVIRHSTAHLLAHAVKILFPSTQVTIGPVIQDGFYYDFAYSRPFTPEDLVTIEAKMHELAANNYPIIRREMLRDEAILYFKSLGEEYKAEIIAQIPAQEHISLYKQDTFEDLCRGPHLPSTGKLHAFKLTKVAGAYWRGLSSNPMLQRIYGTAWATEEALTHYLHCQEEALLRDHRKLGRTLDLFHLQDLSPGMVFWHPKGWVIYQILEQYMRARLATFGYQEIKTPQLVDKILWEKSGHWDNFRDLMFITETDAREYAIKPMNCPCHVQVYNQKLKSYRDLPFRLAEFGSCHRSEPGGALHGLMRVRNMVIDDAHIFCTEQQIKSEVALILELVQQVYQDFGFTTIKYRLALRPDKKVGSEVVWDKAEEALRQALKDSNVEWEDALGEGAFYGPKIECSLADCLGRIWQCGTIQIDFSMPERLEAYYIAEDGSKQTPVMVHRAIFGSFERFIGILLEHYAGKLPLWLAPIQAVILTISEKQHERATTVLSILQKKGIRAHCDLKNEKIGFKIREYSLQKIPYLLIIGNQEVVNDTITVRTHDGIDLKAMHLDLIYDRLAKEISSKGLVEE